MDEELRCLIEAIEKRFDALRASDNEAVKLRHQEMAERLEGFPQQYATKPEMLEASRTLQKLERDTVAREIYESAHKVLEEYVARLDRQKMDESIFQTFLADYRREQEAAAQERRAVAAALAASTERREGSTATWGQISKVIGTVSIIITVFLTIVVLFANHSI